MRAIWRAGLPFIAVGFATAFLLRISGTRAWWVMPIVVFGGLVTMMLVDRRCQVTIGWVLMAAAVSAAVGVVLRLI